MMAETSTEHARWHLIPANDKLYGRVAAFRILADRLGENVTLEPRPIDPGLLAEAKAALNLSAEDMERANQQGSPKVKVKRTPS
jgi:AMP-polyphosphate phosphotransferase